MKCVSQLNKQYTKGKYNSPPPHPFDNIFLLLIIKTKNRCEVLPGEIGILPEPKLLR